MARASVPRGVVTFLLSDVEGSSRLWERNRAAMHAAMSQHDDLVERAVGAHGGVRPVEQGEGDSVVVAFTHASAAVACALDLQRELRAAHWLDGCELRVRIALHTGEPLLRDANNYVGPAINRCARLRAIAHGGQTLVSRSTVELLDGQLPPGARLTPRGVHRLKDLGRAEEVFELEHPDLRSRFPPLRSLDSLPHNLPVQLSSFVGRARELEEVATLLDEHRLVTLVGAGGCGKTRLAVQIAADRAEEYPAGVWWTDLAPLGDPALLLPALAAAVGVREMPGEPLLETVGARLREGRALVVLDNCEHVVADAAGTAEALLRRCPATALLATSREPLGAEGETTYRVPSLGVPRPDAPLDQGRDAEAVRLFVERARAARPGFELTPDSWPAVTSICARLDGMPLALELAAARTRVLAPEQIAEGLGSRFLMLSGGRRTALPRQQTLQHSIDWSHELLDEAERAVLHRASVFAGSFDLPAAATVCGGERIEGEEVVELFSRLVDKSLVQVEDAPGDVRYRLLEAIRQYAAQKLAEGDEANATRDRHLRHYLALAEQAAPEIEGRDQLAWLARLDLEHDNLRAASDWAAASGDADAQTRLAAALCFFWAWRGYLSEGRARAEAALAAGGGSSRARGSALLARADAILLTGDFARVHEPAEEALALARDSADRWLEGRALTWRGWSEAVTGDRAARATLDRAMKTAAEARDHFCHSFALNALGFVDLHTGRMDGARQRLAEALELARETGNRKAIYMPLSWLAWLRTETGDFAGADVAAAQTLELATELRDPVFTSIGHQLLGGVAMYRGDYDTARRAFAEALDIGREHRNPLSVMWSLGWTCWLKARFGEPQEIGDALEAVEEAVEFGERMGVRRYAACWLCAKAEAAHALGDANAAAASWERARQMAQDIGDPWPLGAAMHGQALLALHAGDASEAERLAHEALRVMAEAQLWPSAVELLETLAAVQLELGAPERAARLVGAVEAERARREQPRAPAHERRLARILERIADPRLAAEREAASQMTLADAVAYAARGRGPRQRPAGGWDSLTPAELEVVRLVEAGLTNPQIGERLFISKRTVQAHLRSVFAKVGVASRAELAAQAARRRA